MKNTYKITGNDAITPSPVHSIIYIIEEYSSSTGLGVIACVSKEATHPVKSKMSHLLLMLVINSSDGNRSEFTSMIRLEESKNILGVVNAVFK